MPDQPLLPERAASGQPRPATAPPTDALSLDQAIERYGLSMSTLRRKLRNGELAGAYKVGGPKGEEWRIPVGALEELGYHAKPPGAPAPAAAAVPAGEDVAQALRLVADTLGRMDNAQRQLQAAEEDRGRAERETRAALVEAAELRARLEAERARAERLEADLERARRRRWWQR